MSHEEPGASQEEPGKSQEKPGTSQEEPGMSLVIDWDESNMAPRTRLGLRQSGDLTQVSPVYRGPRTVHMDVMKLQHARGVVPGG